VLNLNQPAHDPSQQERRRPWVEVLFCFPLLIPGVLLARAVAGVGWSCAAVENIYDARLVSYLLEWGYQYLGGSRLSESIWSPPFFFPEPNVLAYSDTYFSAYPFYFPARWSGLGPQQALLFFQLVQLFLTPLVTYACGRWLGLGRLAALTCAFTFGWSWARHFQHMHLQFAAGWVIPLFFTLLFRGLADRKARWLIACLWTLLFAYYLAVYYAYFLVLLAGPLVAVLAMWHRTDVAAYLRSFLAGLGEQPRFRLVLGAVGAATPLALLAYGTHRYLEASRVLGGGNPGEALIFRASLASWLRPDARNLLWGRFAYLVPPDPVAPWEKNTFLGWLALALCLALPMALLYPPARRWLDERGRRSIPGADVLVCAAVIVPLTMLFFSEMPKPLHVLEAPAALARRFLPGFGTLRASARVCLVLSFFTAFIASTWVEFLGTLASRAKWLRVGSVVVAAALVLENVPPTPPVADRCGPDRPWLAIQPRICELARERGAGTLAFLPMELTLIERTYLERIFAQVPAMTLALHCGLGSLNGYTGYFPPQLKPLMYADPKVLACPALGPLIDQAQSASGKPVLIWIEQDGPLGPPLYPVESVTRCLHRCLGRAGPVQVKVEGRTGLVLTTDGQRNCR
jgi:hypothetical protein